MKTRYSTLGDVRGQGPVRSYLQAAWKDLMDDQSGCGAQGGYSDRRIVRLVDGSVVTDLTEDDWAELERLG